MQNLFKYQKYMWQLEKTLPITSQKTTITTKRTHSIVFIFMLLNHHEILFLQSALKIIRPIGDSNTTCVEYRLLKDSESCSKFVRAPNLE